MTTAIRIGAICNTPTGSDSASSAIENLRQSCLSWRHAGVGMTVPNQEDRKPLPVQAAEQHRNCATTEPPWGVEPQTYALRVRESSITLSTCGLSVHVKVVTVLIRGHYITLFEATKEATPQSRHTVGPTKAIGWVPRQPAHLPCDRGGALHPAGKIG